MIEEQLSTKSTPRSESEAPAIYSQAYYERLREVEDDHWWARGMRDVAESLLRSCVSGRHLARVLDAGCGTGGTITWLKRHFPVEEVCGVDVSEHALAHCRARGHDSCYASVLELPFEDDAFDLVVSLDVLQHLPRPEGDRTALREFYRVLKPGGLLLLRCNANFRKEPDAGEDDFQRYTLDGLGSIVQQSRFSVRRLTYANYVSVWTERIRPRYQRSPDAMVGNANLRIQLLPRRLRWLNPILHQLLRLEAAYLGRAGRRLPKGHSTFCIAEKRR